MDSVRTAWGSIPTASGLPLADMTGPQRQRVHALPQSALSGIGYLKITSVVQGEEVLRAIETDGLARSVEGDTVPISGDPATPEPWERRFEGDLISLDFTSVDPEGLSATPLFLSSNPAAVRAGSWTGLRVVREEEDVALDP